MDIQLGEEKKVVFYIVSTTLNSSLCAAEMCVTKNGGFPYDLLNHLSCSYLLNHQV